MIDSAEVVAAIERLPTFSQTVVRLAQLLRDEEAGPGEYEAVVQLDPALTANILRIANSAFFALSRRISSVHDAVTLLGTRRLFEVASMAAVQAVVPPKLPGYAIDSANYWSHSLAVAVLAERLAKERRLAVPALTFTSGLLHDIGKLVISAFLASRLDQLRALLDADQRPLDACEREILGADHAEIGAELAQHWHLPEQVVWAIAHHHQPSLLPDGSPNPTLDLVHAADCLAHTLGFGADVAGLQRTVDAQAMTRLGLRQVDLEHVASRALPEIEGLAQLGRGSGKAQRP